MSTSEAEVKRAIAQNATVSDDALTVDLDDGRTIVVPTAWFPRLMNGTPVERANFRLIGKGTGIHWPALDEDISIESLLAGRRSGETQASLQQWLSFRGFEAFCQRIAECIRPPAALQLNLRIEATEFDAVVAGNEQRPDVIIEFKRYPKEVRSEWLTVVQTGMLAAARIYEEARSRQPKLLLVIMLGSDDIAFEQQVKQIVGFERKNAEFPFRIEVLSNAAIANLTCEQIRSLLYE